MRTISCRFSLGGGGGLQLINCLFGVSGYLRGEIFRAGVPLRYFSGRPDLDNTFSQGGISKGPTSPPPPAGSKKPMPHSRADRDAAYIYQWLKLAWKEISGASSVIMWGNRINQLIDYNYIVETILPAPYEAEISSAYIYTDLSDFGGVGPSLGSGEWNCAGCFFFFPRYFIYFFNSREL